MGRWMGLRACVCVCLSDWVSQSNGQNFLFTSHMTKRKQQSRVSFVGGRVKEIQSVTCVCSREARLKVLFKWKMLQNICFGKEETTRKKPKRKREKMKYLDQNTHTPVPTHHTVRSACSMMNGGHMKKSHILTHTRIVHINHWVVCNFNIFTIFFLPFYHIRFVFHFHFELWIWDDDDGDYGNNETKNRKHTSNNSKNSQSIFKRFI